MTKIKHAKTIYALITEPLSNKIFFNTTIKNANYFYHENFPIYGMYVCMYVGMYVGMYVYVQKSINHISLKKDEPRFVAKSPTALDAFQPIADSSATVTLGL